jgi:hypothetical protein
MQLQQLDYNNENEDVFYVVRAEELQTEENWGNQSVELCEGR